MVSGPARQPNQAAERGAVDDGAASLLAHRSELVLHAGPDAAQVDRVHAVEGFGRFVGRIGRRSLDAGVVEREVEPAESVDRALDQGGDLLLVGHVADDVQRLVTRSGQLLGRGPDRLFVAIGEPDGSPRLGERLRGGEAMPEPAPVTSATRSRKS